MLSSGQLSRKLAVATFYCSARDVYLIKWPEVWYATRVWQPHPDALSADICYTPI